MKLTLDVENTVTKRDGKMHLDPFEPDNSLVMVGILTDQGQCLTFPFDHADRPNQDDYYERVQMFLDEATVLICHNAAHDLLWLWESGFKYDGPVFDTMLAEYVLQRGQKQPLSLEACAERYELDTKKQDTLKEYFAKGVSVRDIPYNELTSYLIADLEATQQLADKQMLRLNRQDDAGLMGTVDLTNQVAVCLARIYQRGFTVDLQALDGVRQEFEQERDDLERDLQAHVRRLMGDTPINLNSPEQLSWVVYSRKVIDKPYWGNAIDPYMSDGDFRSLIAGGTERIHKTKATQCAECNGTGQVRKVKKDGTLYARANKCGTCNGNGYLLTDLGSIGGLRFKPPSAKWASANGFSTSKQNLETLEKAARVKGMTDAVDFLSKVRRLSAVDTYLSSFVDGIRMYTKQDGKLHVRLTQHMTATGRFSGRDPNMQNMPRGNTFPVKRAFVSHFDGGVLLEFDFAQLEFRCAAFLADDDKARHEIVTGFDVHSYTAKYLSDQGQPTSRQEAKGRTFAPLYGSVSGTDAERAYNKHFTDKYQGIKRWHQHLQDCAIRDGLIRLPSGREFNFEGTTRTRTGGATGSTKIKNYPVQSFATADLVPLCIVHLRKNMIHRGFASKIVNTVHDSVLIDCPADEVTQVSEMLDEVLSTDSINKLISDFYDIEMTVPLEIEHKKGNNWLEMS